MIFYGFQGFLQGSSLQVLQNAAKHMLKPEIILKKH